MLTKFFQKTIRNHIASRPYLSEFKNAKVLSYKIVQNTKTPQLRSESFVKFEVICSFKSKGCENNRVVFFVNLYDNPEGLEENDPAVFFEKTFYEE